LPATATLGILGTAPREPERARCTRRPLVTDETSGAPRVSGGSANQELFIALYGSLRQLAERQLRRNMGSPISPTTLLHEAYLGMAKQEAVFPDRERFIGYAARVMRGLIIDF